MCASCLNHLLADGRLKNEMPTCPNCRIEITESLCMRNLAVEKAVSELPTKCKFCGCDVPRCVLEKHEKHVCSERLVFCIYHIGHIYHCKGLKVHALITSFDLFGYFHSNRIVMESATFLVK